MLSNMSELPQFPEIEEVDVKDFFPEAPSRLVPRTKELFFPDSWTQCYAAGLRKLPSLYQDFAKQVFCEIGIGTGLIPLGMRSIPGGPAVVIGSDIKMEAVEATRRLLEKAGLRNGAPFIQSDLLKDYPPGCLRSIHHFAGCIPQVEAPVAMDIQQSDNSSHYYIPHGNPRDKFGLGLNDDFIAQATEHSPQASITLNLSGRPGLERLTEMFRSHGREPQVLHEVMVSQHIGTSLETLVRHERADGIPYEFYADAQGRRQITASEAEQRRLKGEASHHKIYVVHARALTA